MAGIEQLEIHSKSYIVRWVRVDTGRTFSWSVQPHKKSINFGIVKHPGTGATSLALQSEDALPSDFQSDGASDLKSLISGKDGTAQAQLAKKGFIPVEWHGRCEADKVSMGTYDVMSGGMFGLVFDNTFSKQTSKTATFVVLTYPTGSPPHTAHQPPNLQAGTAASIRRASLGKNSSPRLGAAAGSASADSLHSHQTGARPSSKAGRSDGGAATAIRAPYHVGILLKRRRKKGQGYARRFFSLDYATCTLSYYHNRNSSALRGAIPLSLAAIAADERRREISIDSGAEVWHLKASNAREFGDWARALERASRIVRGVEDGPSTPTIEGATRANQPAAVFPSQQEHDRDWQQVEALVSRVVGTRDALRRMVKDLAAQKHSQPNGHAASPGPVSAPEESDSVTTPQQERRSFWRRKSSAPPPVPSAMLPSAPPPTLAVPGSDAPGDNAARRDLRGAAHECRDIYDNCTALLGDLDSVVQEFSALVATCKRRRISMQPVAAPRKSHESTSTDEFFDAEAGDVDRSQLMMINGQSEDDTPASEADDASIRSSSVSSADDEDEAAYSADDGPGNFHPTKPKSLYPLPVKDAVHRRTTIPPATVPPPSLIAFVRKNVGKDLSTISMPVSANEPTSLLQRTAEQLEYANLLDAAARQEAARKRLLYVTAFAVSQFSSGRAKERAIRKPFNPLLGETFELVRSEKEVPGGFRLLVEKVTHRPVRLAMQADSASWSLAQSPAPTQKFWGKSAELTTDGRIRVTLRLPDGSEERYSWNIATVFLRNVVMGEKYVEPVGTMHIANDSIGAKATVEFRSKGMFGGRGEDVQAEAYEPDGSHAGLCLVGTWTTSLRIVEAGRSSSSGTEIWRAGSLVENAANTYGMTEFAASLNETTPLEEGRLPPTDTRLRPDQRLAEQGRLDEAEDWKVRLEEAQRARRRAMEEKGEEHRPRWFVKVATTPDGEEVWRIKGGKEGYWEERARGGWSGVEDIFAA